MELPKLVCFFIDVLFFLRTHLQIRKWKVKSEKNHSKYQS